MASRTNLFAHSTVTRVMTRTKVAPELAPSILRVGAPLILGSPQTTHREREAARDLLMQLSGKKRGYDPGEWEPWVRETMGKAGRPEAR